MTETRPDPAVAVIIAVFEPDESHLRQQIESIASQTCPIAKMIAVVADQTSEQLVKSLGKLGPWSLDILVPETRTNSYRSFELGLHRAVETTEGSWFFALCDQDDVWHANKIATLIEHQRQTGASLVHSDARVVDSEGAVTEASLFRQENRMLSDDPRDLLLRNSVTGMTALVDHDAARACLPFPAQSALFFHHDLWLALIAAGLNGVSHVKQALVDYRQHGGNVVGAVGEWKRGPKLLSKAWLRHWVASYSVATYLAKSLYLRMEEVTAAHGQHPNRQRLERLAPYLKERAAGGTFMADALRHLPRRFFHVRQSAMFGAVQFARAIWAWRKSVQSGYFNALNEFDRKTFAMAPGAQPDHGSSASLKPKEVWTVEQFRDARLQRKFSVRTDGGLAERFVILVPSLNPAEVFAGIATAIDIGLGLAARGHNVLFVATDLPIASAERTRSFILGRTTLSREAQGRIDQVCGVSGGDMVVSPKDQFLATAWWTAHLADRILKDVGRPTDQFYYLIQDYEPGFYAWGTEYTGAITSYELSFLPIFNTTLLRDFFRARRLLQTAETSFVFHPSIDIPRYANLRRPRKSRRRIALYGRPEVPRNLFPVALDALKSFLEAEQLKSDQVELVSIGLTHPDVRINDEHILVSLGKIPWDDYPDFLATLDVGLSLMYSPHPSHPPLEMAAAGARVVTNRCETKHLGQLAGHVLSVEPSPDEVSLALSQAWHAREPSRAERSFELSALGPPMNQMLDELSGSLMSNRLLARTA